jgi:N-acetylmuramic acid 6-phosphate etherase
MALPITEQENPATKNIDEVSTLEALRLINNEDRKVAAAVEKVLPEIAVAVEKIAGRIKTGGRLFYIGTGTSGRLGVLDAAEIPPTFGVSAEIVQGVIAGGFEALYRATESSEDNQQAGKNDLQKRGLTEKDSVIGIAASGRTPYTIGGLEYAEELGCFTAAITCNPDSPITSACEIPLVAVVGPEAIAGSTRMKAGTAQKMILNLISTGIMIRLGYVSGNRMTNLRAKNRKLIERSLRILRDEVGLDEMAAEDLFEKAKRDLRIALIIGQTDASYEAAAKELERSNGVVKQAVEALSKKN